MTPALPQYLRRAHAPGRHCRAGTRHGCLGGSFRPKIKDEIALAIYHGRDINSELPTEGTPQMSKAASYYDVCKAAWTARIAQALGAYEAALSRDDLTDADTAFLNRSIAVLKRSTFPALHPGEF